MEYIYGTADIGGVMKENLKVIGGEPLKKGESLTTRRDLDGVTIVDVSIIGDCYHTATDAEGVRYDFYALDGHYRFEDKSAAQEAKQLQTDAALAELSILIAGMSTTTGGAENV